MNRRKFLSILSDRSGRSGYSEQPAAPSPALEPFVPTSAAPWNYLRAAHLLRRAVVGPTDAEIREAVAAGPQKTVERLLQSFEPSLALISEFAWGEPNTAPPEPEGPRYDSWVWEKMGRRYRLAQWLAKTMADSPVSLQERMTFFWHGHFTLEMGKTEFAQFAFVNNQIQRAYALGNFREMTRAITKDPGMLTYLDGETNTRLAGNENYARELLELFTVGRTDREGKPTYTQQDVIEGARGLTGWQKQHSKIFRETHHSLNSIFWHHLWDDGPKTFLGKTGNWNADDIIEIIFQEKGDDVARFICGKLYRLFVSLTPDYEVIDAMAQIFKESDWEIAPVLRALLLSNGFYNVENIGCLPKSLLEFYVGMIRQLRLENIPDFEHTYDPLPARDLFFRLESLGHLPFHPPNVSGWADGRSWVTPAALVPRIKFARDVVRGRVTPVHMHWLENIYRFDPLAFARTFPNPYDIDALCDDMALFLLGVPPSAGERGVLFHALLDGGREYEWDLDAPEQRAETRIRLFLEALVSLPKFQLY